MAAGKIRKENYMKTSEKKNHNKLVDAFGRKSIGDKISLKPNKRYAAKARNLKKNSNHVEIVKKPSKSLVSKSKQKFSKKEDYKQIKQKLNKEHNEIMQLKDDKDKQNKLAGVCFDSIKGNLKQLVKSPDSSRVVQYFICQSDQLIKNKIFEILKDDILALLFDKHGVFVVEKMFKNMDTGKKDFIFDLILKNISTLAAKKNASKVIDSCFKNFFTTKQRTELLYRFFGPQFLLDVKTNMTIEQILEDQEKKSQVLKHVKTHSYRLMREKTVSRAFSHYIMYQYVNYASESEISLLCKELIPYIKVICQTQHGAEIAIKILLNADASEQKLIVRSVEEILLDLCLSSNSYIFVCAIIKLVKLEGLLMNRVGKMMNQNIETFFTNKYASRVLLFLITFEDESKVFPSDMQNKLIYLSHSEPNPAQTSLLNCVMKKIVAYFLSNQESLAEDIALQNILLKVINFSEKYSQMLVECAFNSISSELNKVSFYDAAKYHHFMKKLIKSDAKNEWFKFSDLFIGNLSNIKLSNIYSTNRGCFIIIILLENATTESAALLKSILNDHRPNLEQLDCHNSKVLLDLL